MAFFSKDLFPTKLSFLYFILYMGLFINQGILVTASKTKNNSYDYNTVAVVLLTECLKLIVAFLLYLREVAQMVQFCFDGVGNIVRKGKNAGAISFGPLPGFKNSLSSFCAEFSKNKDTLLYYFVPAGLYCFYNNLQFENLANYDPTTYYLLLQFRVVVTGIVFQIIFQKQLSRIQWLSLVFLTLGCIVKEYGRTLTKTSTSSFKATEPTSFWSYFDLHLVLILAQVFCSCFAGVYNEYLLKGRGSDIHIMMQNVFMYVDSIICNILVLVYKKDIPRLFTSVSLTSMFQVTVILIMINNAAIGIVVSLFLRSLNSILKTFASALELMFTAVLCWIIFGIAIDIKTVLAIAIVSGATVLYARNPVVNKAKSDTTHAKSEENSSGAKEKLTDSVQAKV